MSDTADPGEAFAEWLGQHLEHPDPDPSTEDTAPPPPSTPKPDPSQGSRGGGQPPDPADVFARLIYEA